MTLREILNTYLIKQPHESAALRGYAATFNHRIPDVWIDHGADEDWRPMCYPPQHSQRRVAATNGVRPKNAK